MKMFATAFLASMVSWTTPPLSQELTPEQARDLLLACFTTYTEANESGFVKSLDQSGPVPVWVVDENQWRRLEFKMKAQFAAHSRCLMGSHPGWNESEFRSNLTNKILGKMQDGELKESE